MKKVMITILAILLVGLTACSTSGITKEEYDSVVLELNNLKNETVDADNISREEYDKVVNEFNDYKNERNDLNKMFRPYIKELPSCKAVASGWKTNFNEVFEFMFTWVPGDKAGLLDQNDFLCFNNEQTSWSWIKLLNDDKVDLKGFELIDFPGGLYISAIAIDDNQTDMDKIVNDLEDWVSEHNGFELDFDSGRYKMTRRITSDETWDVVKEALGYEQLEIMLPIRVK